MPFELRARIGLDNSPLIAGLEQGKRAVGNFKSSIGTALSNELSALKGTFAATFGVAAISAAIRSTVQYAGEVDNLATQLEISAVDAQRFMYVAQQTGSSVEKVMKAMGVERKDFLLTQEQINEKIREFDQLGLGIDDADIARLDAVGDKLDQINLKIKEIIASDATIGILDFIDAAISSLTGDAGAKGRDRANKDIDMFANALKGVFSEMTSGAKKEEAQKGTSPGRRDTAVEQAKTSLNQSFARQFDSLARIGGFMANNDQQRILIGTQTLQAVQAILKLMQTQGESQNYL